MTKKNIGTNIISYMFIICGTLFVLIPISYMISTSLKSISEIMTAPITTLFPKKVTPEAFVNVLTNYPFTTYLSNSVILTVASTVIAVVCATFAGYGFSRFKFKGKTAMMLFILTTQMFPSVMLFVPFYRILTIYGLNNTRLGLTLVYVSSVIPFCTWMMYGFFEGVSKELDEAARIDGCGKFRTFFQIITPLTLPGLISTTIYAFIFGWNEYMFTMLFTSSETMKTLPVAIGQMVGYNKVLWNDLMAASMISSIPVLVLFIFLQRYFISSLSDGAVKG